MDKITEKKLQMAELTIRIGSVIRKKWAIMRELRQLQDEESDLTSKIAAETEALEKLEEPDP